MRFENTSIDMIPGQWAAPDVIVTIDGTEYRNRAVTFKRSDKSVVSVDINGRLQAHKAGQATISTVGFSGEGTYCIVNVSPVDVLRLPDGLEYIDEEAFSGVYANCVIIPEGCMRICSCAFADSSIEYCFVPKSVEDIASDAFDGCDDVNIYGPSDCYAEEYASAHGYRYTIQ